MITIQSQPTTGIVGVAHDTNIATTKQIDHSIEHEQSAPNLAPPS